MGFKWNVISRVLWERESLEQLKENNPRSAPETGSSLLIWEFWVQIPAWRVTLNFEVGGLDQKTDSAPLSNKAASHGESFNTSNPQLTSWKSPVFQTLMVGCRRSEAWQMLANTIQWRASLKQLFHGTGIDFKKISLMYKKKVFKYTDSFVNPLLLNALHTGKHDENFTHPTCYYQQRYSTLFLQIINLYTTF